MKKFWGRLVLAISKKTNEGFDGFAEKFSDLNIERIESLNVRLNDGSVHTIDAEDFNIEWDDEA